MPVTQSAVLRTAYFGACLGVLGLGISFASFLANDGSKTARETARAQQLIRYETLKPQKRTPTELYLTSEQAYDMISEEPDILFVDVRDPLEASLMGHPENIDAIVPVRILSDQFDQVTQEYKLVDNPDFISRMDDVLSLYGRTKAQDIIVICGSGWRSATAVNKLAEHGYTKVWHVVDGYPGEEKIGMNSDHAWRIAGLPWTTTDIVHGSSWHMLLCADDTGSNAC